MTEEAVHEASGLDGNYEYRLLAESIPNLAWIAASDGSIVWYNRRWYEYTGTAPEDMRGWGWQTVHDPATLPSVLRRWKHSIAHRDPFEMTFPLRGADGLFRPFLTRVMPLKNEGGEVLRWFGTNTEIGDELGSLAALRESEQRFRTATEAVSGVLWTNNANGEMRGEQPGWSGFTGQTFEQYHGFGWAAAIHPEDAQPTIQGWLEAIEERRLFSFEHRVRRQDGVYRLCSVRALPIHNEDGSVREWVGVHTDITAQRQAEEALRRNDKLAIAGRLAASIAHEINNPLEAIQNLLYILQHTELDPEQQLLCGTLVEETRRVSEIANHTLRFQREASEPSWTRIEDVIESTLALFSGRLRGSRIETRAKLSPMSPVCGRDGELRQVLANLVGNAIEAMSAKGTEGTLYLRGRNAHGPAGVAGVAVTVADTGPGIPASQLGSIFDPFFTTKGDKGTGLGLWISSEIVRKHEGRLRTRSSQHPERHGTVFRLFLPLQSGA